MNTSKIIKGAVNSGRYTVTAPIVKEDYGLYLKIEGVELPSTYEVDFSNSEHSGTSVTMIGNADGVLIPHQFIETGKDVFAFLYHVGADYGRTVYKFRIPNKVRPDRTSEQPTPEEQSVIDQTINALNEAVAQTAQDVISADQSARSASDDADRAERARDAAEGYASNAQESAQASAQSATASANSATTAQGYASNAQLSATQASNSARSANQSASDALTFANTASNKATEASTSAQTASTKATEASQSASQALSYKTDAESAKTASQTAQGLAESARDSAITAKDDAESARDDAESARDEAQQAVASISGALAEKAPVITDTASGSIASFSDGADDLPLKSLVVDINPVQDLHGQENPYPAGGGKNKVIYPYYSGSSAVINGVTFTVDSNGVITANGLASENAEFILMRAAPVTLAAGDWTISGLPSGGGASSFVWNTYAHDPDNTTVFDRRTGVESYTFNCPNGLKDLYIGLRIISGYNCNNLKVYPQFESGSSATTFAPYSNLCPISGWTEIDVNHSDADTSNPTTITIQLGQTVYGGKLDVLSGVLTVDRAMIVSYNGETLPSTWISDRDAYAQGATPTTGAQVVYKLATPTTVQLTPHEVATLLGVNNIWADSGDTEVVYRADTKAWIQRKIAEAIASLT